MYVYTHNTFQILGAVLLLDFGTERYTQIDKASFSAQSHNVGLFRHQDDSPEEPSFIIWDLDGFSLYGPSSDKFLGFPTFPHRPIGYTPSQLCSMSATTGAKHGLGKTS